MIEERWRQFLLELFHPFRVANSSAELVRNRLHLARVLPVFKEGRGEIGISVEEFKNFSECYVGILFELRGFHYKYLF